MRNLFLHDELCCFHVLPIALESLTIFNWQVIPYPLYQGQSCSTFTLLVLWSKFDTAFSATYIHYFLSQMCFTIASGGFCFPSSLIRQKQVDSAVTLLPVSWCSDFQNFLNSIFSRNAVLTSVSLDARRQSGGTSS